MFLAMALHETPGISVITSFRFGCFSKMPNMHSMVRGPETPCERVDQAEAHVRQPLLETRAWPLRLRRPGPDVGRQRHVERGRRGEERVHLFFVGLHHAGGARRGEVDAVEAVVRAPFELLDGGVDVPERQLGQPDDRSGAIEQKSASQRL